MIMDEVATSGSPPRWFTFAAIAAVLFELVGCYFYVIEVTMSAQDIAVLPRDQAAMLAARPSWYYGSFGVAVWVGLVGAILLLLRRRLAEPLLLVSLVAAIVQFSSALIDPEMREVTPSDALFLPVVIIAIAYGIWMLARRGRKQGWLR